MTRDQALSVMELIDPTFDPQGEGEETEFLVRLSAELTTKARGTRRRFTRQLVDNVREAFNANGFSAEVHSQWTRLLVRTSSVEAASILTRLPGVSSVSPVAATCAPTLDEMVRVGTDTFADRVRGHSFAVRARRSGTHPFSSGDIQNALGTSLNPGATVDLDDPEVVVEVEVRDQSVYFFSGRAPGMGGLPVGVEGKAVCLLSGGFDSGAAAWLLLKRGVELDYVLCNLGGAAYERSVVQVAKILSDRWSYGTRPRLHVVDFTEPVRELQERVEPGYWQIVLKRLMYRAGEQVARETGALAIVTGDSIGQVSSQTLANLGATDGAIELPIFRPLVGFDKQEIVDLTRTIGTHDLSARVKEYCGMVPGNPITNATPAAAAREEGKIDPDVLRRATASRSVIDLRRLTAADIVDSYLLTDTVPAGATVVDLRNEQQWAEWHFPGAVRREPWELAGPTSSLNAEGTYILYCDAGMEAATAAEDLQRRGIEAYAYRGGTPAIRRAAETQGPAFQAGPP